MKTLIVDRRELLMGGAGLALAASSLGRLVFGARAANASTPIAVDTRTLEVNGRAAEVYGLTQANGVAGIEASAGSAFRVQLINRLDHETLVHWHGLTPPIEQDGVPELSQPALKAGGTYSYDFMLERPGTYWMHSHVGLQEQKLHAAPLIVVDPAEAGIDEQSVTVLLHDFTFKDPAEILEKLRAGGNAGHGGAGMSAGGTGMGMGMKHMGGDGTGMAGGMMGGKAGSGHGGEMEPGGGTMPEGMSMGMMNMDLNDIEYDAYLANDRTLSDPEVVPVEPGAKVRLRIINAAASTNFVVDLGAIEGVLIAVDGQSIVPVSGHRFEIAIAQRLDVRLTVPKGAGGYPILAVREGDQARTGVILATKTGVVKKLAETGDFKAPPVRLGLEKRLRAQKSLAARPVDRRLVLDLTGSMAAYRWSLNGRVYENREPLMVGENERVEIVMRNKTGMAHPMHLHGHVFQVVAINGKRFAGAMRDTVIVPPMGQVVIALDADNRGRWAFHCHNLYHMASGMFTTLEYLA